MITSTPPKRRGCTCTAYHRARLRVESIESRSRFTPTAANRPRAAPWGGWPRDRHARQDVGAEHRGGDATIDRIARWLSDRIASHKGEYRDKLEAHWTFLFNNNDRMRYAKLRHAGLPCGSGATEGAYESVVTISREGLRPALARQRRQRRRSRCELST